MHTFSQIITLFYMLITIINTTNFRCQLTPITHLIEYDGCIPKPISSFACIGQCVSSVQASSNGIWQMERSCTCCQEIGEIEATIVLFCPGNSKVDNIFKKVQAKAPLKCMCRPCIKSDENSVVAHELMAFKDHGNLPNFHYKN